MAASKTPILYTSVNPPASSWKNTTPLTSPEATPTPPGIPSSMVARARASQDQGRLRGVIGGDPGAQTLPREAELVALSEEIHSFGQF
ncbi:hypothetical protein BC830DRAFT_1173452 [Chytriomyces sp. MP71]|nr:hypothetical protein BC830DRAFT_1173452 [Chytriomyces sp. MP71]